MACGSAWPRQGRFAMTIAGLGQRRSRDGAVDGATTPAAHGRRVWLKGGIWAGAVVLLLAGAYLLAGYYAVPRLLRNAADSWAQETLKKPIRIGEIKFDPIRFTLDVQDLAIPEGARPMLAAGGIHVHFSILSLLRGPYTFDEVRIDRPVVRAVVRADHSLNLGDLAPKAKAKAEKSGGRAVRIGTFSIASGELIYADDSLPDRPETILTPVAFTLRDFQTDSSAGGAFAFRGRSEFGERLSWTGSLSAAPLHSRGRVEVTALRARTIGAFLGPALPAALQDGLVNVATAYDLSSAQAGLKLALSGANLDLTGLKAKAISGLPAEAAAAADHVGLRLDRMDVALGGRQGPEVRAALPSATVDGLSVAAPGQPARVRSIALTDIAVDTAARKLTAGALSVGGAELRVRRERDGRLSLASLMPPAAKSSAAPAAAASAQASAPWSVHLASFALNRAVLQLDDDAVAPAAHMVVSPVNLSVTDLDSDLTRPVGVRLDARMAGAALKVSGSAIPAKASGDLKVALTGLQLRPLLPYAPPLKDVDLTSGELSASGALRLKGADMSALAFDGQAALDKVSVRQPSTNGLLFSWDAFRLEGLRYRAKGTTVEHGVLTNPAGRVVVMPDRTLNLAAVTGSAGSQPQPAAAAAPAPPSPPPANAAASAPAVPFTLKQLAIDGGTMEFADLSIDPNFQARIQALQGSLSNISNKPDSIVAIDLSGQVIDQYSPVSIKGSMDLSGLDRQTDMHLAFRNIELPISTPIRAVTPATPSPRASSPPS